MIDTACFGLGFAATGAVDGTRAGRRSGCLYPGQALLVRASGTSCNNKNSYLEDLPADTFWKIIAADNWKGGYVDVYTTLEGHISYKGRFPEDNLGNPILHQTVGFLDQSGLMPLNRFMAATFLGGENDENCYTLPVDAAMLRRAIAEFPESEDCRNIMAEPFTRAIEWLAAREDNERWTLSYNVG